MSTPTITSEPTAPARSWTRGASWLGLAVAALSLSNYLFSISMARLLPPSSFVEYVGAQSVLLVIGTGVMAAVPWVVAGEVSRASAGRAQPGAPTLGESLGFGLGAAVVQGAAVALLAGALCVRIGGVALGLTAAVAAFALSLVAAPIGFLQGRQSFRSVALLRLGEGVVRILGGLALVTVVTASAPMAIAGMPLGSLALVAVGLFLCAAGRPMRRPTRAVRRDLTRRALGLGTVQVLLTLAASVDAIVAASSHLAGAAAYHYQTASLLGRAPLFVGLALSQALYPTLVRAVPDAEATGVEVRRAVALYLRLALVALVVCFSVPSSLLETVAGASADDVASLLRLTCVTGVLVGLVAVLSTPHQAHGRRTSLLVALVVLAVLEPIALLVVSGRGEHTFAVTAAGSTLALAVVVIRSSRRWRPLSLAVLPWRTTLVVLPATAVLSTLEHPLMWLAGAVSTCCLVVLGRRSPWSPVRPA